ncbi:hypothetical protein ACFWVU_35965 [Streptomyces sp. NPDC058686]|uniref:hypothetical protein n=1 Tax=Streptomyces sp. NPDC058686 TaxID=3346599 RepID=UPI00365D20CB
MTDIENLAKLFAALGAADPESWARSEIEEGLPQLARYRLLRAVAHDVAGWERAALRWTEAYQHGGPASDAMARALAAGVSVDDLGTIAREVARETAFGLLYRLSDPADDTAPAGVEDELPSWELVEVSATGEATGRVLAGLYEDMAELDGTQEGEGR